MLRMGILLVSSHLIHLDGRFLVLKLVTMLITIELIVYLNVLQVRLRYLIVMMVLLLQIKM